MKQAGLILLAYLLIIPVYSLAAVPTISSKNTSKDIKNKYQITSKHKKIAAVVGIGVLVAGITALYYFSKPNLKLDQIQIDQLSKRKELVLKDHEPFPFDQRRLQSGTVIPRLPTEIQAYIVALVLGLTDEIESSKKKLITPLITPLMQHKINQIDSLKTLEKLKINLPIQNLQFSETCKGAAILVKSIINKQIAEYRTNIALIASSIIIKRKDLWRQIEQELALYRTAPTIRRQIHLNNIQRLRGSNYKDNWYIDLKLTQYTLAVT